MVAQAAEMAEQQTILESIHHEAYVEANRQEWAATDALFDEVDEEMDAEVGAEELEEPELRLPLTYPKSGTEIMDISDED